MLLILKFQSICIGTKQGTNSLLEGQTRDKFSYGGQERDKTSENTHHLGDNIQDKRVNIDIRNSLKGSVSFFFGQQYCLAFYKGNYRK